MRATYPAWQRTPNLTHPLVGIVASATATGVVAAAWIVDTPRFADSAGLSGTLMLAAALVLSLYLARMFPIHIRYSVKVEMGSVPLFLTAVLLAPPVAAVTVGLACVLVELAGMSRRGTHPGDIAVYGGRWAVIGLAGSFVAHTMSPAYSITYLLVLVATGCVLLAGDMLTAPFQIAPITGERLTTLFVECVRSVGTAEAGQYALGIIGALLAVSAVWHVFLVCIPVGMIYRISKRANEMHENTKVLLENMAASVDAKDEYTHEHSVRVREWTRSVLRQLGVVGPEAQLILTAARVHDIGKMWVPDEILHKHEELSDSEWAMMAKHPVIGADILSHYPAFARGAAIVRGHHERFDGAGYPDKIAGMDIPLGARVIAVVDAFDAMTSDRPYRKGMPVERAAAILSGGKGVQWDPTIVDAFLTVIARELERPIEAAQAAVVGNTVTV